jgi:hypothetical protein
VRIEVAACSDGTVAPQPISLQKCAGGPSGPSRGGGAQQTSVRAFVNALDHVLIESANTRSDLAQLIEQVNQRSITADEAQTRVAAVIDQRNALRTAVEQVAPRCSSTMRFASCRSRSCSRSMTISQSATGSTI